MSSDSELFDFIRNKIRADLAEGRIDKVITRFPPEPNGYLHIGHAKSICLNFGIAQEFSGDCLLRFDDTNPLKEKSLFVESILEDVAWLGFKPVAITYASDHFEKFYQYAQQLVMQSQAYVCSLSSEQLSDMRGTLTQPGIDSPYRERSVEENLSLLEGMREGKFAEGEHVLRAKIDMASPNINLRDPTIYRIRFVEHQKTGDKWCIYPTYDFAHGICDALERITHSLCTLEFEDHRPLYEWFLNALQFESMPQQIEFSPLGLEHTIVSKRFLKTLVDEKVVDDWDDPRMPTLSGLRRRGVPTASIIEFTKRIGVTKQEHMIEYGMFEFCTRQHLESQAPRGMAVLSPLKVVIVNYPQEETEILRAAWHSQNSAHGERDLPFSAEIYIDREDFMEEPKKKFKRLTLGGMVRLRYAYIIECEEVIKDDDGNIIALHCKYFKESKSGQDTSGLKPKGVIQWVNVSTAVATIVHVYRHLFTTTKPDVAQWREEVDPQSRVTHSAFVEPAIIAKVEKDKERCFQFERIGYFAFDNNDSLDKRADIIPEFHQVVALRGQWKPQKN